MQELTFCSLLEIFLFFLSIYDYAISIGWLELFWKGAPKQQDTKKRTKKKYDDDNDSVRMNNCVCVRGVLYSRVNEPHRREARGEEDYLDMAEGKTVSS